MLTAFANSLLKKDSDAFTIFSAMISGYYLGGKQHDDFLKTFGFIVLTMLVFCIARSVVKASLKAFGQNSVMNVRAEH